MHLTIHAGRHKTGTTALQNFLARNASLLLKKGFLYPTYMRELSGCCSTAHHDFAQKLKCSSACEAIKELKLEIRKSAVSNVILSSEIFGTFWSVNEIKKIKKNILLMKKEFNLSVILYLRRQDDMVNSWWNQKRKIGRIRVGIEEYFETNRHLFDHRPVVDLWLEMVGRINLSVRVFEHKSLWGGSVIADFLHALQLELSNDFIISKRAINPSLDLRLLAVLSSLEKNMSGKQRSLLLRELTVVNDSIDPGQRKLCALSDSMAINIMEEFAESNAKIASDILGRSSGNLFRNVASFSKNNQVLGSDEILSALGGRLLNRCEEIERSR